MIKTFYRNLSNKIEGEINIQVKRKSTRTHRSTKVSNSRIQTPPSSKAVKDQGDINNVKNEGINSQIIKEIRAINWYNEIKTNNFSMISKEERIKTFLSGILKYVSFDELNDMKPNFQSMYKANVLKFGNLNIPTAIDGIDINNDEDKFTIYDKILKQTIGGRKRLNGIETGKDKSSELTKSLIRLINFINLKNKHLLKHLEKEEIKTFEKEWKKIPEPRVSNLSLTSINLMKGVIGELDFPIFILKDFLNGMINNGYPIDINDTNSFLRVVSKDGITENGYNDIIRFLKGNSLTFNDDSLVYLMNGALIMDEYKLYDKILKEYEGLGYIMSRGLMRSLIQSRAQLGDFNGMMNIIELGVNKYKYCLMEGDFTSLIKGMCLVGERGISMDLLNILLAMRERFESINEDDYNNNTSSSSGGGGDVNLEDNLLEIKVIDGIMPQQRVIEYLPQIQGEMFKWILLTSGGDLKEIERISKDVVTWDVELFKSLLISVSNIKVEESSRVVKEVLHKILNAQQGIQEIEGQEQYQEDVMALLVGIAMDVESVSLLRNCGVLRGSEGEDCGALDKIIIALFATTK